MESEKTSANPRTSGSLIVACATVFVSSFCIMVLELVAGRILARYLGSSLYTWTSVIGVVLGGITIGNYAGGRLADHFRPAKSLAVLFGVSAVCCVLTVVTNNLVGTWTWLWGFSWPARTLLHVSFVFLLPSTLLGMISPVVAKMALERGLPVGRTVGDVYAWGAVGSIAGTFAAGYYLIAMMGTTSIIWAVGAAMALMALLYGARMWTIRACAAFFLLSLGTGAAPWEWADLTGKTLRLRPQAEKGVIYEDETQYCHIVVTSSGTNPEKRSFIQDALTHSAMVVGDISVLEYSYEQIMAAVTHRFIQGRDKPSFLIIGGGGYVLPRYLKHIRPDSAVDVVEIDPGVTKAAIEAFGLDPNTDINTITLDARNYVDELVAAERLGRTPKKYDFIYEDALDHFSVPFQLTTREFNEKIAKVLADDGIYLIELIDTANSGLFLGAVLNTLQLTFPFVTAISERNVPPEDRNTFVVLAAKRKLGLEKVCEEFGAGKDVWYLDDSDVATLAEQSRHIVLTDDHAPVESLLAPIVRRGTDEAIEKRSRLQARTLADKAEQAAWAGNLKKTMALLDKLVAIDQTVTFRSYNVMATIFHDKGQSNEAIEIYRAAIEHCNKAGLKEDLADLYFEYATLLAKLDKKPQAFEQLALAEQNYRAVAEKNPKLAHAHLRLGDICVIRDNYSQAAVHFQKAADLNPTDLDSNMKLIHSFDQHGQFDAAIVAAQKAIEAMSQAKQEENAGKVREYQQFVRFKKSQQKQQ